MNAVLIATTGFVSHFIATLSQSSECWWDMYNYYYTFAEEYTVDIDQMLLVSSYRNPNSKNNTKLGPSIMHGNRRYPHFGKHYYYYNASSWTSYIVFEKKQKDHTIYYQCYVSPTQSETFTNAVREILSINANEIKTIHINTAEMQLKLHRITVSYYPPKPNQENAIAEIYRRYQQSPNKNVKVMISGIRGSYKTFTAKVLKRYMENSLNNEVQIRLYDNLNPSVIGLDIHAHVLDYATEHTPVIAVIDEMDIFYEEVYAEKQAFDPRTQYTRNKKTFTELLDAFGSKQHVITIFTTEKSPEELYANENYRSFLRPGRVDCFLYYSDKSPEVGVKDRPYIPEEHRN